MPETKRITAALEASTERLLRKHIHQRGDLSRIINDCARAALKTPKRLANARYRTKDDKLPYKTITVLLEPEIADAMHALAHELRVSRSSLLDAILTLQLGKR